MSRKEMLLQGWDATYDQEGWYPPLRNALENLNEREAGWKPSEGSHTIRELVAHLIFYKDRFLHRLKDKSFATTYGTNDETFQLTQGESWQTQMEKLDKIHADIREKIHSLSDSSIDNRLPEETIGAQTFSLILHDAYHTGQIILLRKLQGSWRN